MIKLIKKWIKIPRVRILLLILAGALFILFQFIGIKFILHRNQVNFIRHYKKEQQLLVNQVALRFQDKLLAGKERDQDIIRNIVKDVETSARSYWFFGKDNEILYMKDETTAKNFSTITSFLYYNDELHISTNSFKMGEEEYIVGNSTEESYIVEAGQLQPLDFYIVILCLATSLLFTAFIIISFSMHYKQRQINEDLEKLIIEKNVLINNLTLKMKSTNARYIHKRKAWGKKRKIYNKEVLISLLRKIDHEDLVPLNIIIIEMLSANNYPFHEDYRKYINQIFDVVEEEPVIAEISSGVFTLLLFHSNKEMTEKVKNTLIHVWGNPLVEAGVQVRIGISMIEEVGTNMEEIYDSIYKKVMENY